MLNWVVTNIRPRHNAVVERFFGSLKHEWLINVIHLTREGMIKDVNDYIRFYNGTRLHSTLGYKTPNEYENSQMERTKGHKSIT
jgi:putative transposase